MTPDNPRLLANWQPTSVSELIDGKPIDAPLRNMAPLAVLHLLRLWMRVRWGRTMDC